MQFIENFFSFIFLSDSQCGNNLPMLRYDITMIFFNDTLLTVKLLLMLEYDIRMIFFIDTLLSVKLLRKFNVNTWNFTQKKIHNARFFFNFQSFIRTILKKVLLWIQGTWSVPMKAIDNVYQSRPHETCFMEKYRTINSKQSVFIFQTWE